MVQQTLTSVPGVRRVRDSRLKSSSPLMHVDWVLLGAVLATMAIGVIVVLSTSRAFLRSRGLDESLYVQRQLIFIVIGLGLLAATALIDYRRFQAWAPILYIGAVAMLLLVLTPLGTTVNGARGWFKIGGFQIQPAEYAKPVLIVMLAAIAAGGRGVLRGRRFLQMIMVSGVMLALLALQPDLGSAMIYVALTLAMLLVGGAKARHVVALFLVGVIGIIGAFEFNVIKEYQKQRLTCFIADEERVRDASYRRDCYNLNQSQIAIGSGGVAGKGLFRGPQTQGSFVPEQRNDFVFTVIGEEFGFVGSVLLVLLFGVVVWRGIRIARLSKDFFGTLLAVGVTAVIAFQAFLNIGVTIGVMPVTGVTLPLVSYGGSSVLTTFVLIGLLENVHMHRFTS